MPSSLGATSDDKILKTTEFFNGKTLIFTEKMDGENTCMERDRVHARSENSRNHSSRHLIKQVHAEISHEIPDWMALYGENLYATHSIRYESLPYSGFLVFAIIDKRDNCFLSWEETKKWAAQLALERVPVLFEGTLKEWKFEYMHPSYSKSIEGYVVRNPDRFSVDDSSKNMAKWVRENHVQTDKHWSHSWLPNGRLGKI